MKRLTILLLALALLLCACGAPAAPAAEESAAPAASGPAAENTPAPEPEPTPTPEPPEVFPVEFSQTLADTEDCLAEVTALGLDGEGNWIFHLRMENRAGEIQNFQYLYQSINGLCCESFLYRLAVGESVERTFRVFRDTLSAFGDAREVQWSFTLLVTSAESNRDAYFEERCSVCPAGEGQILRYTYTPGANDMTAMDNEYAAVYITGVSREAEGLSVDFVAVNRTETPLRLQLSPRYSSTADYREITGVLRDDVAPYSTLVGYIPFTGEALDGMERVNTLRFLLQLADPEEDPEEPLEGSSVWVTLEANLELHDKTG